VGVQKQSRLEDIEDIVEKEDIKNRSHRRPAAAEGKITGTGSIVFFGFRSIKIDANDTHFVVARYDGKQTSKKTFE
jgi:hypothetical protein